MTVAGIPVRVHFTFVLFLAWIALASRGPSAWVVLVLAVFGCVVLHEFGHALVARRFGVQTRDITLYPIGGIAMLESRPRPRAELWIALAGPAVNVVIATILGALLFALHGREAFPGGRVEGFLPSLLAANIGLVIFNLIPAFPMDGGRVLRASLALRMGEHRATQLAAGVGQFLAIVFGLIGLWQQEIVWMLVAFFVFVGAGQEALQTATRSFLHGHKLADAMQRRYRIIQHGDTLEMAADMLLAGSQHDFPVFAGEELVGLLTRNDIAQGLATEGPAGYVARHMRREYKTAHPNLPLERVADMFSADDPHPVLILDEGELQGMVTQENLSEFIMLKHAKMQGPQQYAYRA